MNSNYRDLVTRFAFLILSLVVHPIAADVWFNDCDAIEVLEKTNFTHVKCANSISIGSDKIEYLAIPHTDLQKLKRFQDLAAQAVTCGVLNFKAQIADPATSLAGCGSTNCREITRFGIRRH